MQGTVVNVDEEYELVEVVDLVVVLEIDVEVSEILVEVPLILEVDIDVDVVVIVVEETDIVDKVEDVIVVDVPEVVVAEILVWDVEVSLLVVLV